MREVISPALTLAGDTVLQAAAGRAGCELFAASPTALVLTDIIMPEREGLETIVALRREFPSMPIIAMSGGGGGGADYLAMAEKLGAARTLHKPFSLAEALEAVDEVLAAKEREESRLP